MALVHMDGQVLVRLWCIECHTTSELVESDDAMMRVKKGARGKSFLAVVEHVAITRLMAEDKGDHLEFRYVF